MASSFQRPCSNVLAQRPGLTRLYRERLTSWLTVMSVRDARRKERKSKSRVRPKHRRWHDCICGYSVAPSGLASQVTWLRACRRFKQQSKALCSTLLCILPPPKGAYSIASCVLLLVQVFRRDERQPVLGQLFGGVIERGMLVLLCKATGRSHPSDSARWFTVPETKAMTFCPCPA